MQNKNQEIVAKLEEYKRQGVTFHQAAENLKQQGYKPYEITDASHHFNYLENDVDTNDVSARFVPLSKHQAGSRMDISYRKIGHHLLVDQRQKFRPYAYVSIVIGAGYLGYGLYRFWLGRKFWASDGDPRYWWANNVWQLLFAGLIGAVIAFICLKIYFNRIDKRNKEAERQIK